MTVPKEISFVAVSDRLPSDEYIVSVSYASTTEGYTDAPEWTDAPDLIDANDSTIAAKV